MKNEELRAAALARAYGVDLGMREHHAAIVEAFSVFFKNERYRGRKETLIQARFIESFQAACRPGWDGDRCTKCKKKIDFDHAWTVGHDDVFCSHECLLAAQG
jgi:hypothetical protein